MTHTVALLRRTVASLALVAVALVFVTHAAWTPTVYTARLDGFQASPTVGSEKNIGLGVCALARHFTPMQLDCQISYVVSSRVRSVQIRNGMVGSPDGRTAYQFRTNTTNQRQTFSIRDIVTRTFQPDAKQGEPVFLVQTYTADQQVDDFLNGLWYIDVWTDAFPLGELRGQLLHTHRMYARLESDRVTTPTGFNSTAQGLMVGEYAHLRPRRRQVTATVVHNVVGATGILVTDNPSLEYHQVIHSFNRFLSPVASEQYTVPTVRSEADMFIDDHYITVTSINSQRIGEIRGQINMIDYIPPGSVSFAASLSSAPYAPAVTSYSRGCMIVALDCQTRLMEYLVVHTVYQPLQANIHAGFPGERGRFLFSLARAKSPIYGSMILEEDVYAALISEGLYVSIASTNHPSGEIRGQIDLSRGYYAYLTGTNMPGTPTTTSAVGCATFDLYTNLGATYLSYEINHNLDDATEGFIAYGQEGQEAQTPLIKAWRGNEVSSPIAADDQDFDHNRVDDFSLGRYFVQLNSRKFLKGAIRGNIYRLQPCSVPSAELALNITLGNIVEPPSPSVYDPLVLATLQINNRTVKIRIGHIRLGAASAITPSLVVLCASLIVVVLSALVL